MKLSTLLKRIEAKFGKDPTAKSHWITVSRDDAHLLRRLEALLGVLEAEMQMS